MNWYYSVEGCSHGPVTERSLAELARSGTVGAGTLIWRPGLEEWEPVSQLKPEILGKRIGLITVSKSKGMTGSVPPPAEAKPERVATGFFKRLFGGGGKSRK